MGMLTPLDILIDWSVPLTAKNTKYHLWLTVVVPRLDIPYIFISHSPFTVFIDMGHTLNEYLIFCGKYRPFDLKAV